MDLALPLAGPCALINETGQVLIQQRVEHRHVKCYPKKIPSLFTDLKFANFGWIGDQFVACDYSYLILGQKAILKRAKWWKP